MRTLSFDSFALTCARACEEAAPDALTILMADDIEEEGCVVAAMTHPDPVAFAEAAEALFDGGGRSYAGMASRTMWSPTPDGESSPAWTLVTVDGRGGPAMILVKRDEEDHKWWRIRLRDAPWFALSTAASLRDALRGDGIGPLKQTEPGDRTLFEPPGSGPVPPEDENGNI